MLTTVCVTTAVAASQEGRPRRNTCNTEVAGFPRSDRFHPTREISAEMHVVSNVGGDVYEYNTGGDA